MSAGTPPASPEMPGQGPLPDAWLKAAMDCAGVPLILVDGAGTIVRANARAGDLLGIEPRDLVGTEVSRWVAGFNLLEAVKCGQRLAARKGTLLRAGEQVEVAVNVEPLGPGPGGAAIGFVECAPKRPQALATGGECKLSDMLGVSECLLQVLEIARQAADSESPVLICGETGTGKEMLARGIHSASRRCRGPFVAINCAAVREALFESELFGYDEGAFTGAKRGGKLGKFEAAEGGTLFLDEVGDMPLHLQAKLLRAIEEKRLYRLGGVRPVPLDVRIMSATNRDLEQMVGRGEFRADLYYRLSVIPIHVPPLRERREDIPILLDHFAAVFSSRLGKQVEGFDVQCRRILEAYDWPGNVRELANVVEYSVHMCRATVIQIANLPQRLRQSLSAEHTPLFDLRALEKQAIMKALAEFGTSPGGKDRAARALGIGRATLYRRLRSYAREEDGQRGS